MWETVLKKRLTMTQKKQVYELLGDGEKRTTTDIMRVLNLSSGRSVDAFLNKLADNKHQNNKFLNVKTKKVQWENRGKRLRSIFWRELE